MMLVRSFPRPEKLPLLLLFVHFPPLKKEYRSFSGVIFVGAKAPCQENPPFLAANPPTSCLLGAAGGLVAFPAQVGRTIAVAPIRSPCSWESLRSRAPRQDVFFSFALIVTNSSSWEKVSE